MNIKEFKQWWNRFEYSGNFPEPKAEHINLLLAELDRLTADRQLEADIDLPPGVITLMRENEGLKASLAEKDAEIEKVTHERDLWENIAAMRLADQVAIERHTRRVVAKECAEIAETFRTPYGSHPLLSGVQIGAVIRNKYGVE